MTGSLLAATTTAPPNPARWIALAVLGWLVLYAAMCALWPYRAHGRCHGTGKLRSPGGKSWRGCRGCAGTGQKVRAGRRGWDAVTNRTDTTTRKKR